MQATGRALGFSASRSPFQEKPMTTTAADVLVETLIDWGVDASSACPATASTASWRRCARGRTGSASSRCATRRRRRSWPAATPSSPGRLGVCLATSGPGRHPPAQRALRRQAGRRSRCWRSPGMQYHDLIGTHTQQDVELDKLFKDVARLQRARSWARRTSRTSSSSPAARRSPTAASRTSPFPVDIQSMDVAERRTRSKRNVAGPRLGR